MLHSYWVSAYFQVRTLSFKEGINLDLQLFGGWTKMTKIFPKCWLFMGENESHGIEFVKLALNM